MALHSIDAYPEKGCMVHTYKRGKTVWVASGEFRGGPLQQTARSEGAAINRWKEIAEWRYRRS